jgi:hypothetical protein
MLDVEHRGAIDRVRTDRHLWVQHWVDDGVSADSARTDLEDAHGAVRVTAMFARDISHLLLPGRAHTSTDPERTRVPLKPSRGSCRTLDGPVTLPPADVNSSEKTLMRFLEPSFAGSIA